MGEVKIRSLAPPTAEKYVNTRRLVKKLALWHDKITLNPSAQDLKTKLEIQFSTFLGGQNAP